MTTTRAFMLTELQERRLRDVCRYATKESGPFWLSSSTADDELSRLYVRSRRGAQYAVLFERNGAGPVRWDDLRIARFDRSDPAGMYAALADAVESFVDRSTRPDPAS